MFETQKSRNKTSSGDIGLNIRTLASPKVGQGPFLRGAAHMYMHEQIKIDRNCNFEGLLHHPFWLSFFGHFLALFFNFYNYFLWLRITDEGSMPEMRIWSILFIKSALKWCIHLRRSLYLYFNYLVSVTAGGRRSPRGHM